MLLVGPGAIGSVWGAMLARAGHDVQVYGRGPRLLQVRDQGLCVRIRGSAAVRCHRVPIHEDLPSDTDWDWIIACVRPPHLPAILDALAAMRGHVVVATNHASGLNGWRERGFVAGFPGITAELHQGVCTYRLAPRQAQPNVFGEPGGKASERVRRLCAMFEHAGLPAQACDDMDGWLRAHAAWMAPLNLVVHRVGGDAAALASDAALQSRLVAAIAEGFAVTRAAEHKIRPRWLHLWTAPPEWALRALLRRVLKAGAIADDIATMGAAGVDEDRVLAEQILAEGSRLGLDCPVLSGLVAEVGH